MQILARRSPPQGMSRRFLPILRTAARCSARRGVWCKSVSFLHFEGVWQQWKGGMRGTIVRRLTMRRRAGALASAAALAVVAATAVLLPFRGEQPGEGLAEPASAMTGLDASVLDGAEALVVAGVGSAYPGAALAVGQGTQIERVTALGRIGWRPASPPVDADATLYDLASLTKAMATTTAVLLLVQDSVIGLDDPVQRHLPGFEGEAKERVTWRHLLTHTSGLPPGAAVRGSTPEERLRRLLRTKLHLPPGRQVVYSDIGYVVLWAAAERAAGEPLPDLLERRIWSPLGMHTTRFAPGRDCEACAPTLRLKTGEPFRGVSNDPLARQLGGIAGHAGLFATVEDVARFVAMIGGNGELDGVRVLDASLAREMLRQQPGAGRRTLGWNAFCPDEEPNAAQPCARPLAYGHTGWTGTSIWLDPVAGHWVVLLTNRSYERADRPVPLDPLRRDLFRRVATGDAGIRADAWLAEAMPATPPARSAATRPAAPPVSAPAR
jgi:serine-type D-Ala-D-Ala carboxypeptidase